MIAETVARLEGVVPASNIFVVAGRRHRRRMLAELPGLDPKRVLSEPVGRNTAACIGWATLEIRRLCADAVCVVLSADHQIGDTKMFRENLQYAYSLADRRRCLVTFGIVPRYPETGYGYIKAGRQLDDGSVGREVEAFVEKPDLATAKRYIASGKYFWNSGMFAWRADVVWEEFREHLPELARGLEKMDSARKGRSIPASVVDRAYGKLPAISIDNGVLEKSRRVAMMPTTFPWSDIGSWDAVAALWPVDASGNATRDPVIALDAARNVVATRGKPVVLLGVHDLIVVDAGDALLVCARERCQDVKIVAASLDKAGLGDLR